MMEVANGKGKKYKIKVSEFAIKFVFVSVFVCSETSSMSFRSSHPEVFLVKGVLKICSKFTGKRDFNKVAKQL